MQNSHCQLVCILIIIFTLTQLLVLSVFGYTPYPDSNGYLFLAKEALQQGQPYPVATMLHDYPFLWNIGAINAVELSLLLFKSVTPLLIVYSLMKGATAWLLYGITKTISNERIALITLILYVVYPANYGESTSTLSELPFMFFIMLGIWLCLNQEKYIIGGMSLALANWFRPMGFVFLLAMVIYLFFINRKKTLRPFAGYAAMIILIGSISMLRTGLFLYQAKTGWMALADYSTGNAPESQAIRDRNDWNVSQKDSAWQATFFDWLKEHPTEYVAQMPRKLVNTYVSDNVNMCTFLPDKEQREYMYDELSMPSLLHSFPRYTATQWLTLLNLIIYYSLLVSALLSLRYFQWRKYLLPVSTILIGTLLLLFVGHGEARFHQPFMPFVILLSALFINQRYGTKKVD